MARYKTITITATSTERALSNALSGIGEKRRRIHALWPCPSATSSPTSGITLLALVDQEEIVEFDLNAFRDLDSDSNAYLSVPKRVPLDIVLEENQGFQLGFAQASTTNGGTIIMEYDDLE